MIITNRTALREVLTRFSGSTEGLVEEIIETFRFNEGLNPWAAKPFVQRARKRAKPAAEVGSLPIPFTVSK